MSKGFNSRIENDFLNDFPSICSTLSFCVYSPAVFVVPYCFRGFNAVNIATATEKRQTVAKAAVHASAVFLSLCDQRISASQAAAHLPERFRKM